MYGVCTLWIYLPNLNFVALRIPDSAADKLTYCAFFDKSTKFGTKVDQCIMNKFGCGAIGQLPPGGRGGHFPKWLAGRQRTTKS